MKDWQDAIAGAVVCSRPCMICDFECVSNPAELQSGPYSTPPHMIRSRLCSTTSGAGLTRRKAALHEKAYQKRIQCRLSQRSLQTHVRPCWCTLTNVHLHLKTSNLESAILNLKTDPRESAILNREYARYSAGTTSKYWVFIGIRVFTLAWAMFQILYRS